MDTADFEVDGKKYTVRYDFNAMVEAEQVTNCNLLMALESLGSMSAGQLRAMLYASLVLPEPDASKGEKPMTLAEVGALIRLDTIGRISSALALAFASHISEFRQAREEPFVEERPA